MPLAWIIQIVILSKLEIKHPLFRIIPFWGSFYYYDKLNHDNKPIAISYMITSALSLIAEIFTVIYAFKAFAAVVTSFDNRLDIKTELNPIILTALAVWFMAFLIVVIRYTLRSILEYGILAQYGHSVALAVISGIFPIIGAIYLLADINKNDHSKDIVIDTADQQYYN